MNLTQDHNFFCTVRVTISACSPTSSESPAPNGCSTTQPPAAVAHLHHHRTMPPQQAAATVLLPTHNPGPGLGGGGDAGG